MSSKAERKRRKKAGRINLPGGDYVEQPATTGRPRKAPVDARREVLEARCRFEGIPATPETMKDVADPLRGSDIGQCILSLDAGKALSAEMWKVWCKMGAARRLYRMRYLGKTGDPQNAAIAMQSDAMQVDPDLRVDMRSPEERDEACKRAEAYWTAQMDRIAVPQWRMALRSAVDGFNGPWWVDGRATQGGKWAAEGLRVIALDAKP